MMITPSNVQPSEAEKKQCGGPLVLSKLPLYVLRILNWIPWKTDSTILIFFTVMFHMPGMTVNIVSVHAISQDYFWPGKYTPELLRYAFITSILSPMLHGYFFQIKSWGKSYNELYHEFENLGVFRKWSVKHKLMLCFFSPF